jgi:hypothetical protein
MDRKRDAITDSRFTWRAPARVVKRELLLWEAHVCFRSSFPSHSPCPAAHRILRTNGTPPLSHPHLFVGCVRLVAISTVCRKELHLWCNITFFSGVVEPLVVVRMLLIPAAVLGPYGIHRVLATLSWTLASPPLFSLTSSSRKSQLRMLFFAGMAQLVRCTQIFLFHIHGPETDTHYTRIQVVERARSPRARWPLGPCPCRVVHISSEPTGTGASPKTRVRVLGFATHMACRLLLSGRSSLHLSGSLHTRVLKYPSRS